MSASCWGISPGLAGRYAAGHTRVAEYPKVAQSPNPEELAQMERELENLERDFRPHQGNYGEKIFGEGAELTFAIKHNELALMGTVTR